MIVMKFGGTSVKDPDAIQRVFDIVSARLPEQPVVVVSAMARATDQLLAMGRAADAGDREGALKLARELRERHHKAAQELVNDERRPALLLELDTDFDALDDLLRGIAALHELSPRSNDRLGAYGEALNSKLVAAAFASRGLNAAHVDSRQVLVTDAQHTKAIPQFPETNAKLKAIVAPLLAEGQVPVMGGFIGATINGITTTIGRGGSDFSAAIFGAGLGAKRIEIWTDVDGMMTTDPRICPDAKRIRVISFEEAAELAYFGAKVLHPATVQPAIQQNIPVFILNSKNPTCDGTKITNIAPPCQSLFKAIAAKKRITIIEVVATRMLMAHGYLRAIFEIFDKHKIPVDVVSTSEVSVALTVDSNEGIPALAEDLSKFADVRYEGRKAIICLVGESIREKPGVAARVFTALAAGNINVRMISQGPSEINITFVIEEDAVNHAIQLLHAEFFKPEEIDHSVFA